MAHSWQVHVQVRTCQRRTHALHLIPRRLAWLVCYLQIVLYAEDAGDPVGADEGRLFVALAIDNAIQLDVTVLHRDADGLGGVDGIPVQGRVSVDGAGNSEADLVVHDGGRIDLDLAGNVFHAWIRTDEGDRRVFVHIRAGVAAQGDDDVLDAQRDGVECVAVAYAVIGQLFAELGLQLAVGNGRASDFNQVADGGDATGLANALLGVGLVLEEVHGPSERGYAVVHGDFHVAILLVVEPCGGVAGCGAVRWRLHGWA